MVEGSVVSVLVGFGALSGLLVIIVMVRAARLASRALVLDPEPVPIAYLQVPLGWERRRDNTVSTGFVRTPSPTSLGGRLAQLGPDEPSANPTAPVIDLRDARLPRDVLVVHTVEADFARAGRRQQPFEPDPELLSHLDGLLADASFAHYDRMRPSCASRVMDTRNRVGNDRINGEQRA